ISLQGYAQRDPLVEYKNRAFGMFQSFIAAVNNEITTKFFRITRVEQSVTTPVQELSTNEDEVKDILTGTREMLPDSVISNKKAKSIADDIEQKAGQSFRNLITNSADKTSSTKINSLKFGRNDKVNVKYSDGRELKQVKFKKVEAD